MLLGDSNIPVTTHTTPVVMHDIAWQLRLQLFVATLGSTHAILGYLKVGKKKDKSVFVSKRKQSKQASENKLYGQTSQMVVDIIITKALGRSTMLP